MSFYFHN